MRIFNVEGFEIKESWMQNTNYPEPPDTPPSDLSVDNVKMWDRYRQEVEKFYNKCKSQCTCKELEKNHEMCPICDEQDYKKFHDKMNGIFADSRNEFKPKTMKKQDLRDKFIAEGCLFANAEKCVQIAKDYADAQKEQEAIGFHKFLKDFYVRNSVKLSLEKTTEELYQLFKNRENER